jgi:hypothetical protein
MRLSAKGKFTPGQATEKKPELLMLMGLPALQICRFAHGVVGSDSFANGFETHGARR